MAFENWTLHAADSARRKRLLFGYLIGALTVGSGIAVVVLTSAPVEAQEEEEKVVEVALVSEPEPEPPPPPPPPPPEVKQHAPNPGPRLPKLETPTTISNDQVTEKEAKPTSGGGDPYEKSGGDGTGGPQQAVVAPEPPPPPPPPPPPQINKPRPVSEDDTAPELIGSAPNPDYPADARAAGIEGVVLVRYIVTETGEVKDAKAMKGPPELFAACVAAVKGQRFKPARDAQGNPIAVVRFKKFKMRIST
ncbi:MAG TPA: energy transducer TonB [Polyangiaceae bacterium]|nr:energy transducer TonB [Polyangiaceae bacterium]